MPKPKRLEGTVSAINVSPRGDLEGVRLETKKGIVQLNFDKKDAPVEADWALGKAVKVEAELEEDGFEHPVYRLVPAGGDVEGQVVGLNYARHGEVNGYALEDGTFVHVKPEGARRYRVRVGDRIRARGERRQGSIRSVVEVHELTRL